ncbi:MAG: histidinol-phosphate transaminase [Gemmatimonadota bacterium]
MTNVQVEEPTEGLRLIKPSVRTQPAYTLEAPPAARKLNQNEAPDDFADALKREVLERVLARPWHRYPEFTPRSLSSKLAAHYGWDVDGILVGNGSNELIQATMAVSVERDDVVVAPAPTFSLYRLLTSVFGGRYVGVPFASGFRYDIDRLIRTAQRDEAKLLVLNTPNNPTGSALRLEDVERALVETEGFVVCDEAYIEFGGESAIPLLATHSRLVVLRTFSKALGLAGMRFGVALAQPAVAREIAKAKLPYNVNVVTLAAAEVALEHQERIDQRVADVIRARTRLLLALRALPGLTAFDSAANFVVIRCESRPAKAVFQALHRDFGILVRDVSGGVDLEECLRISIGREDDIDAVVAAVTTIFGGAT